MDYYDHQYPEYPDVRTLHTGEINSQPAFEFAEGLRPDLILVSVTRLIKDKMLSIRPSIGILNLHTGLSPYVKGGPNCTNWCLATRQFHLIGNTIMWIDLGIDTGNILTTEFTDLDGSEDLSTLHLKVMEHAHSLYLRAIGFVINGGRTSVPQASIAPGKTYYTKEWTLRRRVSVLLNFRLYKQYIKGKKYVGSRLPIITINM